MVSKTYPDQSENAQATADAQTPRHRDVDQLAEDRLATLLSALLKTPLRIEPQR